MATVLTSLAPVNYYSQGLRERFRLDGVKLNQQTSVPSDDHYADIHYELDEAKYLERSRKRLAVGGHQTSVPEGFPTKLEGDLVWSTSDYPSEDEYILRIDAREKEEIHQALAYFKEQDLAGDDVDVDSFPLPTLGQRLRSAAADIYEGRGFVLVRGLDPEEYSVEDFTVVYLGVSSYIAERRGKQDQRGSMLMHVIAKDNTDHDPRDYVKPFHNDTVCDVLALVTRNCSAVGGRSIIASAWTVYNELAATRPDLIHVLSQPEWPFDTYGRAPSFYRRACLYINDDGKALLNLSRRLLVGHPPVAPRSEGIPGLTEAQAEALDAIHFIADKHAVRPSMEKGDIRFINNMAIVHRREAFVNSESNERHLIRLWLNNEAKCWALPEPLKLAWARVFEDSERDACWDLVPVRKDGKVLRVAGSCD